MQTTSLPVNVPDSGRAQHLRVVAGACSVQGARRNRNEDSEYISPDLNLFIVADGMGGHESGEVASKFAVDVLSHELANVDVDADAAEIEHRVFVALDRAHCLIVDAAEQGTRKRPGTTVVFGLLVNHRLYVTGVGDSRAYLIRRGAIERLTIDDTWPDVMFHLGQITADEAKRHYMRNMLISALGMRDFNSNREEIRAVDVFGGDRYLLASDGLTDYVDEYEILKIISEYENPQETADSLVQRAVKNGAGDDVTCVLFSIESNRDDEPPIPTKHSLWRRFTSYLKKGSLWQKEGS